MAERSPEWLEIYSKLNGPEQRRADRVVPPVLARLPHEEVYPTTGWLGQYLLYCQEMEAPLAWHFWCGVSLLGVVARRNLYIDRGRYFLNLHHFVLILGPSGLTKSTTMYQVTEVFKAMHLEAKGEMGPDQIYFAPNRVTLQKMLEDVHKWTKLTDARRDTVLYMVNDELATLVGTQVKGNEQLADFITAMYTRDSYKDSTVGSKDRELHNGTINCLFATTPSSMRRNITAGMFAEGFMGRTITVPRDYTDVHGEYPDPLPADPVVCRQLARQLVPWLMMDTKVEVRPTIEARKWMAEWYTTKHKRSVPNDEKLIAFWQRKQDHLYKLSAVMSLSHAVEAGPDKLPNGTLWIDLPTMQLALTLLEMEEARLPEAFAQVGAREEAQDIFRLQTYIERKYAETGQPVSHSSIFQNCRHFIKDGKHLRDMEDTLLDTGAIEMLGGVGRRFKPKGKQ